MKVGFISHASVLNGAPITLVELVRELKKISAPFSSLLGVPVPGPLVERFDLSGIELFFYGRNRFGKEIPVGRPRIRRRLRRLMKKRGVNLAVVNSLESFRAVEAASDLGIPVIWMVHELAAGYQKRREWAEIRAAVPRADRLIFNSRIALSQARMLGEGTAGKSRVIHPGISLDRPGGEGDRGGREVLAGGEPPVLGCIGDICPQKGYRELIEAFAVISRARPGTRLVVAGRLPGQFRGFKQELDELIRQLNLGDRIRFEGEFFDLRRRLGNFDLLVHPSPSESFGRAAAEALARGVPVVAARSGGVEEIIRDRETGYLVPAGDPEALAAAVLRVLADPEGARATARRGREEVGEKFSLPRAAGKMRAEIEALLGGTE